MPPATKSLKMRWVYSVRYLVEDVIIDSHGTNNQFPNQELKYFQFPVGIINKKESSFMSKTNHSR
jgi:hypothetical protein